ncbi:hypothetical protein RBRAMI_3659 [Pseudomonas aeruginosa RB]|nr:hypothetical protein RBRAMI_3659 [Pseudomonas aeruginosa RB]
MRGVAHRVDSCSCSVHGSIGAAGGARASGARRRRGGRGRRKVRRGLLRWRTGGRC